MINVSSNWHSNTFSFAHLPCDDIVIEIHTIAQIPRGSGLLFDDCIQNMLAPLPRVRSLDPMKMDGNDLFPKRQCEDSLVLGDNCNNNIDH